MKLHNKLEELLSQSGVKRADLAKRLRLSPSSISPWFNGGQPCPEPYLARIVDEVLGKTLRLTSEGKVALLSELFILSQRARISREGKKWTDSSKALAELAIKEFNVKESTVASDADGSLKGFETLAANMVVVTGDKRESSLSRICVGDFGVVSASQAELRWLARLKLPPETDIYSDKIFLLDSPDELKRRFGNKNILVVGSPASNHLARRLHLKAPPEGWQIGAPIFRFNLRAEIIESIEKEILDLRGLNEAQLVGQQGDPDTRTLLNFWTKQLFTGGIVDPVDPQHKFWLRGFQPDNYKDFGLVSMARNPFCDDYRHVCICVAGYHLFGTARALDFLSSPQRRNACPFGGIIRVNIPKVASFSARFDYTEAEWDDGFEEYSVDHLINGLERLRDQIPLGHMDLSDQEIDETLQFVRDRSQIAE